MSKIVQKCPKKMKISHNSLIKVTFLKIWNLCVCKTLFKKAISPKKDFFPPVFKKFGGGGKKFLFCFLNNLKNS
jgi:hypothetical protein